MIRPGKYEGVSRQSAERRGTGESVSASYHPTHWGKRRFSRISSLLWAPAATIRVPAILSLHQHYTVCRWIDRLYTESHASAVSLLESGEWREEKRSTTTTYIPVPSAGLRTISLSRLVRCLDRVRVQQCTVGGVCVPCIFYSHASWKLPRATHVSGLFCVCMASFER